jgi:hypothetical protein
MIRALISTLGLAIAVCAVSFPLLASDHAQADTFAQKSEWQERYRSLLRNAARLEDNVAKSRENYARAQRRNYPRGGARQQFIIDADEAEKELVTVKAEIEQIFVDARHNAVPTNWLYEVDDEPIMPAAPASVSDGESDEDDRAGRNPLYFKD